MIAAVCGLKLEPPEINRVRENTTNRSAERNITCCLTARTAISSIVLRDRVLVWSLFRVEGLKETDQCSFAGSSMLPTSGRTSFLLRDAARHTAGAKRSKYFRRIFQFKQMDFEFASWQMLYLLTAPQKVYRNFHYRKQTKDQWARDDPAFLVILSIASGFSTIGFGFVLDLGLLGILKLLLWVVFIDCIGVGLFIATVMW
uniref:protein unc-50 homolog n=1 Tax=Myxine glutinosa TaxID=7769 RepID=UPI00358F62BA